MANQTGELWALVQGWMDGFRWKPPSQRDLAREVGVSHTTVTEWKYARSTPSPTDLRRLAEVIGENYEKVLDAALVDAGYRDRRESSPPPAKEA